MSLRYRVQRFLTHPAPLRTVVLRSLRRLLPYEFSVITSAAERPHYGYCLLQGARLARCLGHRSMSAIEFGVAAGQGLLALERHAVHVERLTGVKIDLYGFDSTYGLPQPKDYRDLPYHWQQGLFLTDREALKRRLTRATLVEGDVSETVPQFLNTTPAPIGAIFHDLDFYSSTAAAFGIFDIAEGCRLPRIFNYFDDVAGNEMVLCNEHTGELLAIQEYNACHKQQKLAQIRYFQGSVPFKWHAQVYIHHDFTHSDYCVFVSEPA